MAMQDKELLVAAAQASGENNPFWQAVEAELDKTEKEKPKVEPRKLGRDTAPKITHY